MVEWVKCRQKEKDGLAKNSEVFEIHLYNEICRESLGTKLDVTHQSSACCTAY